MLSLTASGKFDLFLGAFSLDLKGSFQLNKLSGHMPSICMHVRLHMENKERKEFRILIAAVSEVLAGRDLNETSLKSNRVLPN